MARRAAFRTAAAGAAAIALLSGTAGVAQAGDNTLPDLQYPAQVAHGETFTLSGTECPGTAVGWLTPPDRSNWSMFEVPASSGNWSVRLTVDPVTPPGSYTWEVSCARDGQQALDYPDTQIDIVPTQTPPTPSSSSSTTTATSSTSTTTAAPTTTARSAAPSTARPAFTG